MKYAHPWLLTGLVAAGLALPLAAADPPPHSEAAKPKVTWKKTVVDPKFRAEGVAVADVNRDGKLDILVGDVWYEAPDWKVHEIRKPKDYGNGAHSYSECFACWADDINHDGWPDLIVIGFPGKPCYWYENPKGKPGHWKEHVLWHSACNETPQYADLFGTGKRVLVMGWQPLRKLVQGPPDRYDLQTAENEGQMAWFAPGKDPTQLWEMHPISAPGDRGQAVPGTFRYSHGLGVGDVNGDGRPDVICTGGWWEQPARLTDRPWKFHPADLGPDCADMVTYDVNGDGKPDVISSSAHNYGIWWHEQKAGPGGKTRFARHALFPRLVSQTHALHCVDIDGDGLKDLVTGKRWWAHGPAGDADPNAPPLLYWFEARKGKDGLVRFVPHVIDKESGVGTQFWVGDLNGDKLPDVVVANKRGVFVFEQVRGK